MNDIADRLEALIPQGDGYNSEYAHTLTEAVEALRRDAEIGKLVRLKMTSGNSVPVERCIITAAEIAAIAHHQTTGESE